MKAVRPVTVLTEDVENRPSSFDRRVVCPGSGQAEFGLEETTSAPAKRGSDLHAVVAALYLGSVDAARVYAKDLPDEDFLAATEWVEWLKTGLPDGVKLEVPVDFRFLGMNHVGKADYAAIDEEGKLFVGDLKTGRGPWKKPSEAWQLRLYAIGLAHTNDELAAAAEKGIRLVYFTPEDPGETVWREDEVTWNELVGWEAQAVTYVNETKKPNAPRRPDPDACHFCKAKTSCVALRDQPVNAVALRAAKGLKAFTETTMSVEDWLLDVTPQGRAEFFKGLVLAAKWIKAAEEATSRIAVRNSFAGLELRPSKVDKKWYEKDVKVLGKALRVLAKAHGVTMTHTEKTVPLSVAAILKLFPVSAEDDIKELFEEIPAKLVLKPVKKGSK